MTQFSARRSAVAVSVVLTLGLAACGSSTKSTPSDSTVKTSATTAAAGGATTAKAP